MKQEVGLFQIHSFFRFVPVCDGDAGFVNVGVGKADQILMERIRDTLALGGRKHEIQKQTVIEGDENITGIGMLLRNDNATPSTVPEFPQIHIGFIVSCRKMMEACFFNEFVKNAVGCFGELSLLFQPL